jgi:hypothetical protein
VVKKEKQSCKCVLGMKTNMAANLLNGTLEKEEEM